MNRKHEKTKENENGREVTVESLDRVWRHPEGSGEKEIERRGGE